ncbi:hypothetical protein F2Q69_00056724 [Brassica cretica]|uniref:Uncharacterized protein n=1 Tax=Brassica cretica TaxID=69181 RepID=A0A8S9MY30_BRACR|nr:hypothetical protein F2Q69_00056724 [Brassica cretica]
MKLVTHKVGGVYGEGTLSFTYRFLEEQVTIPIVPGTTPQPFIIYVPVPHHPYGSANPVHGASGYMAIHPGVNIGPTATTVITTKVSESTTTSGSDSVAATTTTTSTDTITGARARSTATSEATRRECRSPRTRGGLRPSKRRSYTE